MLRKQYRYVLQVPYYEFEKEPGKEAEYIDGQLTKLRNGELAMEAPTHLATPTYETNPILTTVEPTAMTAPPALNKQPVMPIYRSHSQSMVHSENSYSSQPEPIYPVDESYGSNWNCNDPQYSNSNGGGGGYNSYSNRHVNYGGSGGGYYSYRNNESSFNSGGGGGRPFFGRSRSHEPYSYHYGPSEPSGSYYGAHHQHGPPPTHHQQRMSYQQYQ